MSLLKEFKTLHFGEGIFVLPNAWDVLSAKIFEQVGFRAIGTTSWGVANSFGYSDGEQIDFKSVLSLAENIIKLVNIPLSIDIESGYSDDPNIVVENVLRLADLGVSGINIEDSYKRKMGLKDVAEQSKLIYSIRKGLDGNLYNDFFINARIDVYFHSKNPLEDALYRSKSYVENGADGIFLPGVSQNTDIETLINSIDVPLNVMSLNNLTDIKSLSELGVKRFSLGNSFSDATINFIESSAKHLHNNLSTDELYFEGELSTIFK